MALFQTALFALLGSTIVLAGGGKSANSGLEALRKEFPELVFNLENNKDTSDIMSTVSKFLQKRQHGDGHMKDEMFTMLDTILAMMKWQGFVDDQPHPVWSLIDYGFDLLADYVKRKDHDTSYDGECPYSYDKIGDLCLATDLNAVDLTWHEARLYCQIMKGGELAIFRDANQFHNILKYVRKSDHYFEYGFWVGASSEHHPDFWKFINGEYVPQGTPFWGRANFEGKQSPSSEENANFGFLDPEDYHYLHNIELEGSDEFPIVPLCQYFPGRGHNSHYGYHAEGYYHQGVDQSIANKLPSILGLSSQLKDH